MKAKHIAYNSWTLMIISTISGCLSISSPALADNEANRLECVRSSLSDASAALPSSLYSSRSTEDLRTAAQTGDLSAVHRAEIRALAERYEKGIGVSPDLTKAAELYQKAAFQIPPVKAVYSPGFGSVPGSTTVIANDEPVKPGDLIALGRLGALATSGKLPSIRPAEGVMLLDCSVRLAIEVKRRDKDISHSPLGQEVPRMPMNDQHVTLHEFASVSLPSTVFAVAWSPNGKYIASSFDEGRKIALADADNGRIIWMIENGSGALAPPQKILRFSADSTELFTSSPVKIAKQDADKTTSIFAVSDGRLLRTLSYQPAKVGPAWAMDIVISGNGRHLFVIPGMDGNVLDYDTGTWNLARTILVPENRAVGQSAFRARLALDTERDALWVAHSGFVHKFDLKTGTERLGFQAFQVRVSEMTVNPISGDLVVGGVAEVDTVRTPTGDFKVLTDDVENLVKAFDTDGQEVREYRGPGGSVEGLAINPNGSLIAAAKSQLANGSPAYVLIWEASSGTLLAARDSGQTQVNGLAFSPGGDRLAFSIDGTIRIVNILH